MRIGIVGSKGYLGKKLVSMGYTPLFCDITKPSEIVCEINKVKPDILINCAGMTNVDKCEKFPVNALKANARGVMNLLDVFNGKLFIQLSTDHIFSGKKYFPLSEKHSGDPINVYGQTKLAGEFIVSTYSYRQPTMILRTSKLFSYKTIVKDLEIFQSNAPMEFTNIIKRSFLHLDHFVDGIKYIIDNYEIAPTILNLASLDTMSYANFWVMASKVFGFNSQLVQFRNNEIEASPRPLRGGLNVSLAKKLGVPLYSTLDGLEHIKEMGKT